MVTRGQEGEADAVAAAIQDGMTVSPSCQGLLGEIPGYTWQPNRGGGFKEEPVKVNDDACDALRYLLMGRTWWQKPDSPHPERPSYGENPGFEPPYKEEQQYIEQTPLGAYT